MAATFPLLNLSPTVSERVLGILQFSELFDLAQCSKRAFNLVKTAYKISSVVSVSISRSSSSLILYSRSRAVNLAYGHTSWEFFEDRHPKRMDLEDPRTYNIDGMLMEFCTVPEVRNSFQFGCLSNHSSKEFLKFCAYIMNLFSAPVKTLNIYKQNCLEELQSILEIRSLRTLCVRTEKVSHEEMRKILAIDTITLFTFSCRLGKNFTYDLPIRANMMMLFQSSWVNAQILRNLDCKNAILRASTLANEDLNSFLKHWLQGSNTRLEFISVTGPVSGSILPSSSFVAPYWNISKIVEGIPTFPGAAKRPDVVRYHVLIGRTGVPYENGLDLKRESDGMLATVVLFKDRLDVDTFLFEVWQVPDPNVVVV